MAVTHLDTRQPSRRWRLRSPVSLAVAAALAATVGGAYLEAAAFNGPEFVPRVAFVNDSPYDVQISVRSASTGTLPLGAARQRCTTAFHEVTDQGDRWLVGFRAQGIDADEVVVDRDQLARDGWTYAIPAAVVAQFEHAGAPHPPAQTCPDSS